MVEKVYSNFTRCVLSIWDILKNGYRYSNSAGNVVYFERTGQIHRFVIRLINTCRNHSFD
ncbi:MAG: hypothetical protein EKK37_14880 [Sphingobacteriales bacterium]|nr:MAG: hypothetical protein EKK37_14880 [Sphingobacteriales bacterium]